jgi:hypothetical protein
MALQTINRRSLDISGQLTLQQAIEQKYNRMVEHVLQTQCAIDTYTDDGAYVPVDLLDTYNRMVERAAMYAAEYGFDCDLERLDA